jgi:hypothetical protein
MRFYTQEHREYCGIDLHARSMYVCILDADGKVLAHSSLTAGSKAAPVERHHLEGRQLDTLQAAHVDGRLGGSRLVGTDAERRATAVGAEVMLDPAGIEGVTREVGLGGGESQLLARYEPEKVTALAADRTVTFDDLLDIAFNLEGDSSAMASALINHRSYSLKRQSQNRPQVDSWLSRRRSIRAARSPQDS